MCFVLELILSIFAIAIALFESVFMIKGGFNGKSIDNKTFRMCNISFAVSDIAIYSASEVDVATFGVIHDVHEIGYSSTNAINPNEDRRVITSSPKLASEYALMTIGLLSMDFPLKPPLIIKTDSNNAMAIAKIERINSRTKHIDIRYHFIRELMKNGALNLIRVDTTKNLSDCFTKNVGPNILAKFTQELNKYPP